MTKADPASLFNRVVAEIELKQGQSNNFVSDWDPFAETWTTDDNDQPDTSPTPYVGPFVNSEPITDPAAMIARRRSFYGS
jgi:hypothetical protein